MRGRPSCTPCALLVSVIFRPQCASFERRSGKCAKRCQGRARKPFLVHAPMHFGPNVGRARCGHPDLPHVLYAFSSWSCLQAQGCFCIRAHAGRAKCGHSIRRMCCMPPDVLADHFEMLFSRTLSHVLYVPELCLSEHESLGKTCFVFAFRANVGLANVGTRC